MVENHLTVAAKNDKSLTFIIKKCEKKFSSLTHKPKFWFISEKQLFTVFLNGFSIKLCHFSNLPSQYGLKLRGFALYFPKYEKNTSSEHVVYKNCFECQNKNKKTIFVHQRFWTCVFLVLKSGIDEQSVVILWVNWFQE